MFKFTKRGSKKSKITETRIKFTEESSNGLFIKDTYIPEELLSILLCYIDHKTLLACQLVCKQWHFIIQGFVWHKKTEMTIERIIPLNKNIPWQLYYFTCAKIPFGKNLIKNHSGEMGIKSHWTVSATGGNGWIVESPPNGVPPLPHDSVFEGKQCCFVTSYYVNRFIMDVERLACQKYQIVDLVQEGFSENLLDNFQPKIRISEWICSRWDCAAIYGCRFELICEKKNKKQKVLDTKKTIRPLINKTQNEWIKIEHVFENYGKGLRKIKFLHGGQDQQFWVGHFGSKMAGACVKVENPLLSFNFP